MNNIQTSPDLDITTRQMHIIIGLSTQMQGRKDFFSLAIRQAIKDNKPSSLIIDTVKDAYTDAPVNVGAILGVELTKRILSL